MGFQTCLPLRFASAEALCGQFSWEQHKGPLYSVQFLIMALSSNHLRIWIFACGKAVAAELLDQWHLDALFALILKIKLFGTHLARASIEHFQNSGNASSGKSSKGKGLLIRGFFYFFFFLKK